MSIGYIVATVMSPLRAGLGPWSWSCKIVLVVKSLLVYHSIVWWFQIFLAPTNVTTVAVLFGLKISSLCQSWYHYCPAGHVMSNNDLSICRRPRGLCMVWVSVLFHWWSSCLHHWRTLWNVAQDLLHAQRQVFSVWHSDLRHPVHFVDFQRPNWSDARPHRRAARGSLNRIRWVDFQRSRTQHLVQQKFRERHVLQVRKSGRLRRHGNDVP